jgi:choline-glycine betaine transporter
MARETPSNEHDAGVEPAFEPPSLADEQEAVTAHYPVDRVVFGVAAAITVAFIAWGVFATDNLSAVAKAVLDGIITGGGWAFVLAASGFVVFAVWLAVSRYGRIPLGRDDEAPEFRTSSWIAMMFSAGMGIGLMFYGVAEPSCFAVLRVLPGP